jgi:predicted permease
VALVSEGLWRSRFGANPSVLGRSIDVDGVPREVIGVMPASFRFPGPTTALWLPLQLDPVEPPAAAFAYGAVARLKAGVTIADAKHDFAAVLPRAPEIVPNFVPGITTRQILDQVHPEPTLVPLRDDMTGAIAGTLWIVAAAASLVLLVACANVTNLTLVRGEARQRDIRVREALGAGRMRLSLQGFVESGLVALAAGLLGLAGAGIAVRLLVNASPAAIPRLAEVSVNARVVIFAVIVVVIVTVACGLAPALRLRRSSDAIHQSGRGQTVGRAQRRLRGALVVVQVAVALVVLAGAGLLVRTVTRLHAVRPGFDAAHVSTYWLSLPAARYQGDPRIAEFYSRLAERAASLPGVEVAGLTSRLPLEVHGQDPNPLYPENDTSFANRLPPLQLLTAVDDGYFRVMDIPLLAGRAFDRMGAQHDGEAIVSSSTAQFFWKDAAGTAVGKRFRLLPGGRLYTVIGVVADVHDTSLTDALSQAVYFPELAKTETAPAQTKRTMALVVRSGREQDDIGAAVRQIVHDLDPMLPVFDVRPMSAVVDAATTQVRFVIVMLGAAAAVTLVLGAVGLYGVLAYVVTLRRRELGIRLALGASPRTVAMALTRDGLVLAAAGIAAGLTIFLLVSRFLGAWLFDVAANDPATIGTSAAVLLAIAMAASWAPARRAARVDPVEALRAD